MPSSSSRARTAGSVSVASSFSRSWT
jgi:hypothetical protein